jgi:hypothetical protein
MVQDTKDRAAPFFSFSTFRTGLQVLGQGLPEKIDKTVFRSMDFNKQHQMVGALKFFGLIDEDGMTQDSLRTLVAAPDDQRAKHIKPLIEAKYPRVVELATKQASEADLLKAMRELGLNGEDPIRKGIAFYRQAAEFTGLPVSPHWPGGKPGRKPSGGAARSARKRPKSKRDDGAIAQPQTLPRPPADDYSELRDSTSGLIRALIKRGPTWNEDQAKDWVQSFLRAVRFDYPAQPVGKKVERKNTNGKRAPAEIEATVTESEGADT